MNKPLILYKNDVGNIEKYHIVSLINVGEIRHKVNSFDKDDICITIKHVEGRAFIMLSDKYDDVRKSLTGYKNVYLIATENTRTILAEITTTITTTSNKTIERRYIIYIRGTGWILVHGKITKIIDTDNINEAIEKIEKSEIYELENVYHRC